MKNIFKATLYGLLTFLFFYLLGAFFSTSIDISKWEIDTRFIVALFGGTFSGIVMIVSIIHDQTYGGNK
jgi:uncharacterized membrane-anchored protein YitT (DUF2179 family)